MPNMSYCRFHNTLSDLEDCREALESMQGVAHLVVRYKEMKKKWEALPEMSEDCSEEEELEHDELCEEMDRLRDQIEEAGGLSREEYRKAQSLLELCREIADSYEDHELVCIDEDL